MFKILEKNHVGPETIWKIRIRKNHSGSKTLLSNKMLQSQPGGGSLRQGVRVPRRELQHGAGREGDLPHAQVSRTVFFIHLVAVATLFDFICLALPRDESIPPGRRVEDTSRHHRGRPLSCWCYIGANIVAFHPWLEVTWHCINCSVPSSHAGPSFPSN